MSHWTDDFVDSVGAYLGTEQEWDFARSEPQYEPTEADLRWLDSVIDEWRERNWWEHYSRYCQQHGCEMPCEDCAQELEDERREEGFLERHER